MRVLYCHDNIYQQCQDGVIYSPGQFPYGYWKTFLQHAEHLVVAGRGVDAAGDRKKLNTSGGPNVSFVLFPNINTPMGRLKYLRKVDKRLKQVVADSDAVIIRAVSDIGWLAYKHAKRQGKPIAMEMAACAWDSTWHHGNILGKLYAPIRYMRDKIITKNVDFVIYVSQKFLQNRYPTNGEVASASNVRIDIQDEEIIEKRLHAIAAREDEINIPSVIGLIGNLDNKIKGVPDVLRALAKVEEEKPGCFVFRHLGPGNAAPHQKLAQDLGIEHLVYFDGMIQSGREVLGWLEGVDVYLQPSYQEGVPRATIEAMSMGCPVIASTAGGIPELIDQKWLTKSGHVGCLADLIIEMLDSPSLQIEAARENYIRSQDYTNEILTPRRNDFWGAFIDFARSKEP